MNPLSAGVRALDCMSERMKNKSKLPGVLSLLIDAQQL
jgi:hypothetical protein